ncbi:MAG: hypothetical protein U0930_03405 [Pirellulales bacterium]
MNVIQGTPATLQVVPNLQTPPPQISPTVSLPNQPLHRLVLQQQIQRPRPYLVQVSCCRECSNLTSKWQSESAFRQSRSHCSKPDDPDAFQGRIPTINDLPVPDITVIDNTKNLLVSSQRSVDSGPQRQSRGTQDWSP